MLNCFNVTEQVNNNTKMIENLNFSHDLFSTSTVLLSLVYVTLQKSEIDNCACDTPPDKTRTTNTTLYHRVSGPITGGIL